ncbi:hypothetical protein EJ04DRAFT_514027 [Polyplosphaeria fusca]|uniref:Uncharacterized protein n=1 Tax=Polyplosphaeria fusca TaxID=682080 RepID=A0A9P4QTI6_9PLEO|nr:hypothetical protein EJ04DRAFT_514027 [Polyplosphaeria fusca]
MQEWKDVKKAAAPGWLNRPSTFTSTTPTAQPQARTVATLADKPHIKQSLGPQRGFILGKVRLPSKQSLDAISPARPFISTLNSSIVRPPPNLSSRIPSTSSKRRDSDTEAEVNNLTDRLPHQTKQTKAKLDTFEKYAEYNHKGEKESTKEIKSEQTKPMTLKRNIDLEDADKDGSEVESQQPKPMELKRKIDLDGYDRDEIEDESVGESDDEGVKKRRIF